MSNSRKKNKMLAILLSIAMIFINFAVPSAGFAQTSPSVYKVLFDVKDGEGNPVEDPSIHVWTEYWDGDTEDVLPDENGRYEMDKWTDYNYTVSKEGYVSVSETGYVPDGPDAEMTLEVTLQKDSPDQKKAEAVKKQFDKELGALRPDFAKDKNICEMVLAKVKGYSGLDTEGVTVTLASSDDDSVISKDGKINYIKKDELTGATNSKNVRCSFNFECGKAKATSSERTVTVGWDRDFFNGKIKEESKLLTADKIKGENKSLSEVTKDLTLPRCMGSSLQKVWSTVSWESSDPNVISFVKPEIDSDIYPLTGKVHPTDKDKTVTLTATFSANDTVLNSYLEKTKDFETVTVKFDVTVKGNGTAKPSEDELKALLDKYYTADVLKDSITGKVIDPQNVTGDIQLPRYTKIKDENGKLVFKNKELKVTSGNEKVIKINGYRANVDIFSEEDPNVELIVEFTREGVTVEKRIPLKVGVVTDEELDAEIAKMELAKKHYFDGINDGRFANPESVTGDLRPFKEMRTDKKGNPEWIYSANECVGDGIVPDDFFEDSWEMEGAGYNKFKSSDNSIIKHDNLLVTKPENTTKVEISSLLSSAKYGKYAKAHPENKKLQKLYKQEVKVTVTVKGTNPDPNPEKPDVVKTVKLNVFGVPSMDKAPTVYTGDVSSDEAKKAGYTKSEKYKNEVTVIDSLVVLHRNMFGEDFDKNPEKYLKMSEQGWISKIFGVETFNCGYLVNGKVPEYPDKPGTGSVANDTVLGANDTVSAFIYSDTTGYSDIYLEFTEKQITAKTGEQFNITLQGMKPMSFGAPDKMSPKAGFTVRLTSVDSKDVYLEAVTDKDGNAQFTISDPGVYTASVVAGAEYYIQPYAKVTVEKSESYDIDKAAAKEVDAKIDAIGKVDANKKEKIEKARKAYDGLTEAQKKFVTKLDVLIKAEKDYENIMSKPAGYAYISVDRATIGQGYLVEPVKVPFYKGENGAQLLNRAMEMHNLEIDYTGDLVDSFYMSAVKNAGGDLTATFPAYLQKYIDEKKVNVTNPRSSESLGEFDYTNQSGWVYKYDNRHAPVGASGVECKDGMVFRWAFTVCGFGSDCWNTGWGNAIAPYVVNKDELIKKVADFKASESFDELMKSKDVKAAYDNLIKVGTDNEIEQPLIDKAIADLDKAVKSEEMYAKEAKEVDAKIEAIGEVTLEKETAITDARIAYATLSEGAKAKVTKLAVLEAAEAKLAELKAEAADKAAAKDVDAKIEAIGVVTLDSKADIEAARKAYDALTEAQKKLVTKLADLEKAETEYKALYEQAEKDKLDKAAAKDVDAKIEAIGVVTLDSKADIEAARKAYDALTEAQKKLVTKLADLEKAETEYKALYEQAEKDKLDKAAAKEVDAKIEAIGKVTLESKADIEAARKAYDALTEAQKKLVTKLADLEKAETEYKALYEQAEKDKLDKAAAKEVDAKIEAIGEVTLESKADIEEARKAYDALTEAQKKLVTKLADLEKAEKDLKTLEDELAEGNKPGADDNKPVASDKKPEAQAPNSSKAPQTGDDTQTAGLAVLLIGAVCVAYMARKKEN